MSLLSLLVRLAALVAVLCVLANQADAKKSSSKTVSVATSSFETHGPPAPVCAINPASCPQGLVCDNGCKCCLGDEMSSSSSSSAMSSASSSSTSAPVPSVDSSSSQPVPVVLSSSSSSSSSSASPVVPTRYAPVIYFIWGCNSSLNDSSPVPSLQSCDGSTGTSQITIAGANFTTANLTESLPTQAPPSFQVQIACPSRTYSPKVLSVLPTQAVCNTPTIDKLDANVTCQLSVVSRYGVPSAKTLPLTFVSWSTDVEDDVRRLLGMSFVTAMIVISVVGLVILISLVLCTLACCCGVSLACLNCCTPRSRSNVVVLSPQASGYSSFE